MVRMTDRRALLLAAGGGLAAAASAGFAVGGEIRGVVEYEGGGPIPRGRLLIGQEDAGDAPATRIDSDGKSASIAFSLVDGATGGRRVVVRLERADGWLLARGSATPEPGRPVTVTLYAAMY